MSSSSHGDRRFDGRVLVFDYGPAKIRCGGTADQPWFVAQDVCDVFGIKEASSATRDLPSDEKGLQTLQTPGGKQSLIVVYESGLYRLIFRSNKPGAEEFKRWVFGEVLPSLRKTGVYRLKQRQRYQQLGLAPDWIERREQGIVVRKEFTDVLHEHGIEEGWQYGACTNAIYQPTLKGNAAAVRSRLGLPAGANIRDNLPTREILKVALAEHLAAEKIEVEERNGYPPCHQACAIAANAVANAERQVLLNPQQQQ